MPGFKNGDIINMGDVFDTFNEDKTKNLPSEMIDLAREYRGVKEKISFKDRKLKILKKEQAKREEKLFAIMTASDIDLFGNGGYTFFTRVDSYPSIDSGRVDMAHNWIKEEGYEHIIKKTVNLQTLKSVLKEVFETTGTIPSEDVGIKIRTVNRVGVRKK